MILVFTLLLLVGQVQVSAFVIGTHRWRRLELPLCAASSSSNVVISPPEVPFIEDTPIWEVPQSIRRETTHAESSDDVHPGYVKFLSLEDVFGGTPCARLLADKFDSDASFRRHIRVAMRDDLFVPDPKRSEKVNRFIKDLGSSLHVSWMSSASNYGNLTNVFQSHGIKEIDGESFIKILGGMAGGGKRIKDANGFEMYEQSFKSLIDIVNPGSRLKLAHSWHQDSGLPAMTLMLGFSKVNGYQGAGVFSHAMKLSHPLKDQVEGGGQVIQYEQYLPHDDTLPSTLPEEFILRPWYSRGREIMVYSDHMHLHSAPDHIHRESVWRFM